MCVSLVNRSVGPVGHTTEMSGSHRLDKYVRFHSNLSHWPQSALCQAYLLWSSNVVVTSILVNMGSGDALLTDGTKPLPEPILST